MTTLPFCFKGHEIVWLGEEKQAQFCCFLTTKEKPPGLLLGFHPSVPSAASRSPPTLISKFLCHFNYDKQRSMSGDLFVMTGVLGPWIGNAYLMSTFLLLLTAEERCWKLPERGCSLWRSFFFLLTWMTLRIGRTSVFSPSSKLLSSKVLRSGNFHFSFLCCLCEEFECFHVVQRCLQLKHSDSLALLWIGVPGHLMGHLLYWRTIFLFYIQKRAFIAWNAWAVFVLW